MAKRNRSLFSLGLFMLTVCSSIGRADQPVFNEMPRWNNGWGVQVVEEHRKERDLMSGSEVVAWGFSEEVNILHVEGVYTWDKSVRLTAKLPFVVDAQRELPDENGGKVVQNDEGIGDLTLALPLKRYFNLDGRSGSWTFAPQMRVPLSGDDEYEVYDGAWGGGLSVGYETETYDYLFSVGASTWLFEGDEASQTSAHVDLGINLRLFGSSGHIKWETDFIYKDDGTEKLMVGPHLYWKLSDLLHTQIMYKEEVHARRKALDHGNARLIKVGMAMVF